MFKNNILKQKKGIAIFTVLIVFLVMMLMLGGLAILSQSNLVNAKKSNDSVAAFYAAEAGINKIVFNFQQSIEEMLGSDENPNQVTFDDFFDTLDLFVAENTSDTFYLTSNSGETVTVQVTFIKVGENEDGFIDYKIIAVGSIGSLARTLEKTVSLQYFEGDGETGFTIDKAILVNGNMRFDNNSRVFGAQIATYSRTAGAIQLANNASVHSVELLPTAPSSVVNRPSSVVNGISYTLTQEDFPLVSFSDIQAKAQSVIANNTRLPQTLVDGKQLVDAQGSIKKLTSLGFNNYVHTYTIPKSPTGGYVVPEMVFEGTTNLIIDVPDNTIIVTDKLWFDGYVEFRGAGTLTIYVKSPNGPVSSDRNGSFRFPLQSQTTSSLTLGRPQQPHRLIVFVDDIFVTTSTGVRNVVISTANNLSVSGAFMFSNASIDIANGSVFGGYLVTGGTNVRVSNNGSITSTLYYAPYAYFEMLNGASLNGAVLADSFYASNGAQVTYNPLAFQNFPFQVLDPITGDAPSTGASTLNFVFGPTIEQ